SSGTSAETLVPGSRVGRYIVIDHLGSGGMGEVFLGSDGQLRRKVALKRLFVGVDGDARSKILHEARSAARISHPNVAGVYDVFEHNEGAFLVMEYVAGESLETCLRRARLSLNRLLAIGRDLAAALTAAVMSSRSHWPSIPPDDFRPRRSLNWRWQNCSGP